MGKTPPSFDMYPDRYLGNTRRFSCEEHGAYFLLLLEQWQSGSIPTSVSELMFICRVDCKERWQTIWKKVGTKFETFLDEATGEEILANPKMREDRIIAVEKYEKAVARARKNGSKGGRPKKPTSKPNSVLKTGSKKTQVLEGGRGKKEGSFKEKKRMPDIDLSDLDPRVQESVKEWLAEKTDRGELYTPRGLKAFKKRVEACLKTNGPQAVAQAFSAAIENGWKGWDHGIKNAAPSKSASEPKTFAQRSMENTIRAGDDWLAFKEGSE